MNAGNKQTDDEEALGVKRTDRIPSNHFSLTETTLRKRRSKPPMTRAISEKSLTADG